jgi:hypothetical protein
MKTVVILDMAHCGTTMIATVLQTLGVPMTLGGDRGYVEDAALAESLRRRAAFEELIEQRSGQLWGFKHPGAWRFAPWFECLDDPVYLAIYKEPGSVARGYGREVNPRTVHEFVLRMQRSTAGIIASGLPVHCLSYLEAVRCSYAFVEGLAEVCRLGVTQKQVVEAADTIKLQGIINA